MSTNILIVTGVVFFLLIIAQNILKHSGRATARLPYSKITYLMSKSELHFWQVLKDVVPQNVIIYSKVRLCDLVRTKDRNDRGAFARISSKHVDFVLCDGTDSRILAVIELDDRSHNQPKRKERDRFVDRVMDKCMIPILHVKTARYYDRKDIRNQITHILS